LKAQIADLSAKLDGLLAKQQTEATSDPEEDPPLAPSP
jgi:hypothetical protein